MKITRRTERTKILRHNVLSNFPENNFKGGVMEMGLSDQELPLIKGWRKALLFKFNEHYEISFTLSIKYS